MAKPDLKRSTDVPSTIAGFYYQIILACRELCKDGVEAVGVETGADVVVTDKSKEQIYMEAKLHTSNFNRFSNDVIKTIYNFYNDFKQSDRVKQMIFVTNADVTKKDKPFFDSWGMADAKEIAYIQEAVLRKSIELHEDCKKCYNQFCTDMQKSIPKTDNHYLPELLNEVFIKKVDYQYANFAVENSECTYKEFIQKLKFKFCNQDKNVLLEEIERETIEKIRIDYEAMPQNTMHQKLSEEAAEQIFCSLVKRFFDCVAENSQKHTNRKILASEYQNYLIDCYNGLLDTEKGYQLKRCLKRLAYDEDEILRDLDLELPEDQYFLKCYSSVKDLFIKKMHEEGGTFDFLQKYFLKEEMIHIESEIDVTITELIRMLAVILYEEKISIDDVKIFFDEDFNNLEITQKLVCCYKHIYGKTNTTKIIRELAEDIGIHSGKNNMQILVAEAGYTKKGRPCELKELFPEPYNIAQTDENYKTYQLLRSLNYKCTDCLELNGTEYEKFWEGGGCLCKKI